MNRELKLLQADCAKKKSVCESFTNELYDLKKELVQKALDAYPRRHPSTMRERCLDAWLNEDHCPNKAMKKKVLDLHPKVVGSCLDLLLAEQAKWECVIHHLLRQIPTMKETGKISAKIQCKKLAHFVRRLKRIEDGWGNNKTPEIIAEIRPRSLSNLFLLAYHVHKRGTHIAFEILKSRKESEKEFTAPTPTG